MRLASIATPVPAAVRGTPSDAFEDALMRLDWAHESAGSATSDPEFVSMEDLLSASADTTHAAQLLEQIDLPDAARHASAAASNFTKAALAKRDEAPDVANGVVRARGEDAELAIHAAFSAMGQDNRGE